MLQRRYRTLRIVRADAQGALTAQRVLVDKDGPPPPMRAVYPDAAWGGPGRCACPPRPIRTAC
ncbi:hypothetical protein FUT89_23765 [Ralstonia pseudosolanacearum]|nr:hypothetical protein RSOE_10870 [Ralstonia solanacearum OE1-1]TXD75180.1 hypothetical protein FUT89_23765 [Ralstonia pseudosolanacearum]